jgi:hypothetical protein
VLWKESKRKIYFLPNWNTVEDNFNKFELASQGKVLFGERQLEDDSSKTRPAEHEK